MNLIEELKWRNLLKDVANLENIDSILNNKDNTFYIGIDPTADSLHLGHYMVLSLAKLISQKNITPIFVLGGLTAMIGDPSGKNKERQLISMPEVNKNVKSITTQLKDLINKLGIKKYKIKNNLDFYKNKTIIDLYQKYGKLFNLNQMLHKELIQSRLEVGISYTEFSYQLFQAIDFLELYEKENTRLQVAGSDQWGNIVTGIDLIKKVYGGKAEVSGLTVNLLTDRNGNKIGKTEEQPIWLNEKKFSSYNFFQYILNLDDETSLTLLKSLTDIDKEEYENITKKHKQNPSEKLIQDNLALKLMTQIYSKNSFKENKKLSKLVFTSDFKNINKNQAKKVFGNLPSIKLKKTLYETIEQTSIIDSKRKYREFLNNNSIKINGQTINNEEYIIPKTIFIDNAFMIINIGKKNKFIIWK